MAKWLAESRQRMTGLEGFEALRQLLLLREGVLVEIADTGPADTALTVRHALGRRPTGHRLVRAECGSGAVTGPYNAPDDAGWTETTVTVRFGVANARVLLELF